MEHINMSKLQGIAPLHHGLNYGNTMLFAGVHLSTFSYANFYEDLFALDFDVDYTIINRSRWNI